MKTEAIIVGIFSTPSSPSSTIIQSFGYIVPEGVGLVPEEIGLFFEELDLAIKIFTKIF